MDQQNLFSSQEEEDVFQGAHALHLFHHVMVWSPDIDAAILCVHFSQKLKGNQELWFYTVVKDKLNLYPPHSS